MNLQYALETLTRHCRLLNSYCQVLYFKDPPGTIAENAFDVCVETKGDYWVLYLASNMPNGSKCFKFHKYDETANDEEANKMAMTSLRQLVSKYYESATKVYDKLVVQLKDFNQILSQDTSVALSWAKPCQVPKEVSHT
jgi:hypothetical protein